LEDLQFGEALHDLREVVIVMAHPDRGVDENHPPIRAFLQ
jgi:hypothetical protein